MKISLIVAMSSNRAIGLDGRMPWHLSADLRRFKRITLGKPILMGRKTHQAIGRPLPGRENLVVSRAIGYEAEGCLVFADIDAALAHCQDHEEVFVIGGAELYRALLDRADCLYLTCIDQDFVGDTFFPEIDAKAWREVESEAIDNDPTVDFRYRFLTLSRAAPSGRRSESMAPAAD